MHTAPFWRTADKVGFMIGSMITVSYSYVIGAFPNDFFYPYYCSVMILLLTSRVAHYYSYGWHYFITDFCYYANSILLYIMMFESKNEQLFKTAFLFSHGALGASVYIFRNSLVLHKIDMLTSLAIHLLPITATFHIRWVTIP
jgi:hypothetical protein